MVIRDGDSRRDRDEETEERDDAVIGEAFWRSLALIVAVGVIGAVVAWRLGLKSPPPQGLAGGTDRGHTHEFRNVGRPKLQQVQ